MLWRLRRFFFATSGLLAIALWFYTFFVISLNSKEDNIFYPTRPEKTSIHKRRLRCIDHKNQTWDLPAVPNFILAGVQKGGTTALRNLLVKHPKMVASLDFERHFFDAKLFGYLQKSYQSEELRNEWLCDVKRQYIQSTFHSAMLDAADTGLFFFEKTPSYLVDPDVPALINRVCPWAKVVVILRDPIERSFSHYKMEREKLRVKIDFSTVVEQEVSRLNDFGLSNAPLMSSSNVDGRSQLPDLTKKDSHSYQIPLLDPVTSDKTHKLFFQTYPNTNFLQRGMYSIQLRRWLKYFVLGESLLVLKFEDMQTDPARVYETILDFLGAPRFSLSADDYQKSYQTRGQYRRKMEHAPISNETRRYLDRFFQPYNEQLADILGQNYYGS